MCSALKVIELIGKKNKDSDKHHVRYSESKNYR